MGRGMSGPGSVPGPGQPEMPKIILQRYGIASAPGARDSIIAACLSCATTDSRQFTGEGFSQLSVPDLRSSLLRVVTCEFSPFRNAPVHYEGGTMTGRRVSLTIVAVALLVALVVVPVAAGRTITTTGANVFVGEEDLSFTAIPANETVVWWVHYLDDSPGGNWYSLPLRATNGVITELNGDIPVGLYYVFTNAVETNLSDRTSARGYINVQTPEVKLDVVLSNSRLDSVNGKSVTHDNTLDFELMNNLNGLPNGVMNIEVTLPSGGVTTQFGGLSLSGIPVDGSTQYRGAINLIKIHQ